MKLQIALDLESIEKAIDIVREVDNSVDIIEVGTPLIIKFGTYAVKKMREVFPDKTILADTKIADGGYLETKFACDDGADIITVLAISADETILSAKQAAQEAGRKLFVDMLSIDNLAERSRQLDEMGVDIIGVHTAFDVQKKGRTPFGDLKVIRENIKRAKVAVAGGVKLETISLAKELGADIAIVGSALVNARDRTETAKQLKAGC